MQSLEADVICWKSKYIHF